MSRHVQIALKIWPAIFGALLILGMVRFEQYFMHVVESFNVTEITREADGVFLRGHMIKSRHCEFIGVTAIGDPAAGTVSLKFLDDDSPGTFSRPTGSQTWGPWKVFVPLAPKINAITLTSSHGCHPFWVTRTELVKITINGG